MKLGLNIDHIAVLRNARQINDPNPLDALGIAKRAKVDQITIHLREDRRHIDDNDALNIIKFATLPINLECSIDAKIIDIVCKLRPNRATLVPEKREEVTTEGGLNVTNKNSRLKEAIKKLHDNDIEVSLFIDPINEAIEESSLLNVSWVELHTGNFSNIYAMLYSNLSRSKYSIKSLQDFSSKQLVDALSDSMKQLKNAAKKADEMKIKVAAGHGLNYENVTHILEIKEIQELNIGQSIIARSIFTGLKAAILDMKKLLH